MDSHEVKSKDSTTESSEKHAVGETKEVTSPPDFRKILETFEETNDTVKAENIPTATDVLPPTVSPCKIGHVCESEAKNVNTSAEDLKAITENVEEVKKVDNTQSISEIPSNVKDDRFDLNNKDKEFSSKDSAEKKFGKPMTWATWKSISKSQDSCSGNTEQAKKVDTIQPISEIPSNVKDDRFDSNNKGKEISSKDSAEENVGKPKTRTTWKSISVSKDSCSSNTKEAKKVDNTQPITKISSNVKEARFDSNNKGKEISSKDSAEKKFGKPTMCATWKPISKSKDSCSGSAEEAKKEDNTQTISEIPSNAKDRIHSNNEDKEISLKDSAEKKFGKPKTWATWKSISKSKDSCSSNTEQAKKVDNTQCFSEIPSNVKEDCVASSNEDKEISSKDSAEKNLGSPTTWATWKSISKSTDSCSSNTKKAKKVDNTQSFSEIPSNVKDDRFDSNNNYKEISSKDNEKKFGKPMIFATRKPISKSKDSFSGTTEEVKKVVNTQRISEISSNVKDDRVDKDEEISSKDSAGKKLGKPTTWATWKSVSASKDSCSGNTEEAKKVDNTQTLYEIPANVKADHVDSINKDKEIPSTGCAEENVGKPMTRATWKSISVSKYSFSGNTDKTKKEGSTKFFSEIPSNVKEDGVDSNNNYKEISSKDSAAINVGNRTTWTTWKTTSHSKDSCSGNTKVKTSDTIRISPKASAMKPVTETRESRSKIMQVGENVLHQPLTVIEDEDTLEELVSDEIREELLKDLGNEGIKDDKEIGIDTSDLPNPTKKKISLTDLEQSFISALNTPVKLDTKVHVAKIEKLVYESVQAIEITDASEIEKEKKPSDIVEDTKEKTPTDIVSEKDNFEASDDAI